MPSNLSPSREAVQTATIWLRGIKPVDMTDSGYQNWARRIMTSPSVARAPLTMRRAQFVYNAARLAALAAGAPVIPVPWDEREEVFCTQFCDMIERQCGPQRSSSPEELHGSWMQAYVGMGWTYGEQYDRAAKIHPDLVPYARLRQLERDKDAVFVALCEIARRWIYD